MATDAKEFNLACNFKQFCESLETNSETGLDRVVAEERLKANGPNLFTIPEKKPFISTFCRNAFSGFGLTLSFSAVLSFIVYEIEIDAKEYPSRDYLVSTIVLLLIFICSGSLRYLQENADYEVASAFKALMPMYCTVLRNTQEIIIPSKEVVVGDVLVLCKGERIAADVRFFQADDLVVNNVALSGISQPIHIDPCLGHTDKWMARNAGFAGSHVVQGSGRGVVVACGDKTDVGVITQLSMASRPKSRERKHILQVTVITSVVVIFSTLCMIITMAFGGVTWNLTLSFIIGVMIAFTPIGISVLMYFALNRTKRRLLAQNCQVSNLEASCTIGLTSVICSDMRGTMTMGRLRVSEIFIDDELFEVDKFLAMETTERTNDLIRAAVLCNDADIKIGTVGVPYAKKGMNGNAYDIALLKFARNYIDDIGLMRRAYKMMLRRPYNGIDRFHLTVHKRTNADGSEEFFLLMKGFYELVLDCCRTYQVKDKLIEMDDEYRIAMRTTVAKLLNGGRQVRAFAYRKLPGPLPSNTVIDRDFVIIGSISGRFLGLIAAHDPPRANVIHAVEQCRSAGIKLVLITKKNAYFAQAVATELGVIGKDSETIKDVAQRLGLPQTDVHWSLVSTPVINMREMRNYKETRQRFETQQILLSHSDVVFAATTAMQHHMIVDVCQSLGAVVTVVGCSVHDTPPLRRANVGVAKGIASSQVAKSCADISLVDDNFASVVSAIEESRLLFENKKKALTFVLSSCMPQILARFAFILLKIPYPMLLYMTVIMDLLCEFVPAMSLFYEKPEENLLQRKPKVYDDFLINRRVIYVAFIQVGVIQACAIFTVYFIVMARAGFLPITLIGLSIQWYDEGINDLTDSYGQEWSYEWRMHLEDLVSATCLMAGTILQAVNLILLKTGRVDLLSHGFSNHYLTVASIYMIAMAFLLCQIDIPQFLHISAIKNFQWLWYLIPFIIMLIVCESIRKYLIRNYPNGWLEAETYY